MNNKITGQLMTLASAVLTFTIVYVVASHGDYSLSETLLLAAGVVALSVTTMIDGHMSGIAIAIKALSPGERS
jgi:hypothetical protein